MGQTRAASGTLLPYLSAADVVFMDRIGGFGSYSLFGFALAQKCQQMNRQTISRNHIGEDWVQRKLMERTAELLGFLYNTYTIVFKRFLLTLMIKSGSNF